MIIIITTATLLTVIVIAGEDVRPELRGQPHGDVGLPRAWRALSITTIIIIIIIVVIVVIIMILAMNSSY